MTLRELADAIGQLTPDGQGRQAAVWPPGGCPARVAVNVTGLGIDVDGNPVILTGKEPTVPPKGPGEGSAAEAARRGFSGT